MKASQHAMMIIATLFLSAPALAGGLGEAAPALEVAEWVKGDPVVLADGKDKNVYVILFVMTPSTPSRAACEQLNKLQQKQEDKNVVCIAISGEKPEILKQFVAERGSKMRYRLGRDQNGACAAAYLRAFGASGLPHAFVIDKSGNVVWHAHPRRGLDKTVEAVLAGTHDIEAARRLERAQAALRRYLRSLRSPSKARKAGPLGEKVLEYGAEDMLLLNDLAWAIATEPGLIERDLDLALRAAQSAYEACDGKDFAIVDTYARVLFELGRKEEAVTFQEQAVQLAESDEERAELGETLARYKKAVAE